VHALVPLPVAAPLAVAALLGGAGHFLPRRVVDTAAILAAAAVTGISAALVVGTADRPLHVFFGGWRPRGGLVPGIAFDVDPLSAALAALAGALAVAGLVFAWHYFEDALPLFHVLVLLFLAGMVGFALSDDLFNLFVFFQLMGIPAFALTAYRIDEPGPLQGALAFGILNTLAGSLLVLAIALVYGRTGALNLVDAGAALAGRPPDLLVAAAFGLVVSAFLVKAGVVPFHFWLADAYAAAPAPVCVLLSGVMSDLGIHAIARVHASAFAGAFAHREPQVRAILVALGVAGALIAAVMSFLQADLKRMLAFLTASHAGIFLAAVALFRPDALAGEVVWVVGDGLAKGALFLCVGFLLHELQDGDELRLHGRGRRLPVAGALFAAAAAAVALLPPFGTFLGFALVRDAAVAVGFGWLPALLALAAALSGAAVLRAGGRVFLGLGDRDDPLLSQQPQHAEREEPEDDVRRPRVALAAAGVLLALALGLAVVPGVAQRAAAAAAQAQDRHALVEAVLHGVPEPPASAPAPHLGAAAYGEGVATTAGALVLALVGLYRRRLPRLVRVAAARLVGPPLDAIRAAHSGVLGDYVAWLVFGSGLVLGLFAALVR
jgi:multicomponent Na+:H+ antiporter subunit D